jgi:hypothetical protein
LKFSGEKLKFAGEKKSIHVFGRMGSVTKCQRRF